MTSFLGIIVGLIWEWSIFLTGYCFFVQSKYWLREGFRENFFLCWHSGFLIDSRFLFNWHGTFAWLLVKGAKDIFGQTSKWLWIRLYNSSPLIIKEKCVWQIQVVAVCLPITPMCKCRTHFGFINTAGSEMHSFEWKSFHFSMIWSWTPSPKRWQFANA